MTVQARHPPRHTRSGASAHTPMHEVEHGEAPSEAGLSPARRGSRPRGDSGSGTGAGAGTAPADSPDLGREASTEMSGEGEADGDGEEADSDTMGTYVDGYAPGVPGASIRAVVKSGGTPPRHGASKHPHTSTAGAGRDRVNTHMAFSSSPLIGSMEAPAKEMASLDLTAAAWAPGSSEDSGMSAGAGANSKPSYHSHHTPDDGSVGSSGSGKHAGRSAGFGAGSSSMEHGVRTPSSKPHHMRKTTPIAIPGLGMPGSSSGTNGSARGGPADRRGHARRVAGAAAADGEAMGTPPRDPRIHPTLSVLHSDVRPGTLPSSGASASSGASDRGDEGTPASHRKRNRANSRAQQRRASRDSTSTRARATSSITVTPILTAHDDPSGDVGLFSLDGVGAEADSAGAGVSRDERAGASLSLGPTLQTSPSRVLHATSGFHSGFDSTGTGPSTALRLDLRREDDGTATPESGDTPEASPPLDSSPRRVKRLRGRGESAQDLVYAFPLREQSTGSMGGLVRERSNGSGVFGGLGGFDGRSRRGGVGNEDEWDMGLGGFSIPGFGAAGLSEDDGLAAWPGVPMRGISGASTGSGRSGAGVVVGMGRPPLPRQSSRGTSGDSAMAGSGSLLREPSWASQRRPGRQASASSLGGLAEEPGLSLRHRIGREESRGSSVMDAQEGFRNVLSLAPSDSEATAADDPGDSSRIGEWVTALTSAPGEAGHDSEGHASGHERTASGVSATSSDDLSSDDEDERTAVRARRRAVREHAQGSCWERRRLTECSDATPTTKHCSTGAKAEVAAAAAYRASCVGSTCACAPDERTLCSSTNIRRACCPFEPL